MQECCSGVPLANLAFVSRPAPLFCAEAMLDGETKTISLESLRGRWVILFFYPLDFTFICPTEITEFSKRLGEFDGLRATVLGCSTDSVHSHKAWLKELGPLRYPLLSDMTHEISRAYGVLLEEKGVALRGTFIIDPEGILRYALYHDLNVGRSCEETLRVLAGLQTGELCQAGWKPGDKTLG